MLKSGIIFGLVGFFLALASAGVGAALCSVCLAVFLGLGAGYAAGAFDRPLESGEATKQGAAAGALTGGLMIFGQIIGGGLNAGSMVNNPDIQMFNDMLGLPPADPTMIWISALLGACCIGLLNLGILAGLGAAGGALWGNMNLKNDDPSNGGPPQPIPPAA